MSNEIKYTTDGKKVLVVGKLNSQETIVQEIFVAQNGQEIPSGANFVTKSLHDAPVESWKQKELRRLETNYETAKKDWGTKIEKQRKRCRDEEAKARIKADSLFDFSKNSNPEQLDLLKAFMAGEITHFFKKSYSPKIVTWGDEMFGNDYHGKCAEHIKLVSLFGSSKGDLGYRICQYRDGSGGWETVIPCRSYEEALKHAQECFDEKANAYLSEGKGLNLDEWTKIEGLVIPEKVLNAKTHDNTIEINKKIAALEAQIEKLKNENN
jgi:hypothetical protein